MVWWTQLIFYAQKQQNGGKITMQWLHATIHTYRQCLIIIALLKSQGGKSWYIVNLEGGK